MSTIVSKASATVTPVVGDQIQSVAGREFGEFDVILSTKDLDRDGDELRPEEWKQPLPDHITFDSDHGMSVATTVGSGKPFINAAGQLQVRGTFASTSHAQNVRTLVNEGHIRSVSVAFANLKTTKDNRPQRELLNGAFVAVPANPEAVVLSSKSASGDDVVPFADPGYRDDGLRRYPLNSPENVLHSALDFAMEGDLYEDGHADEIRDKIAAAASALGVMKELTTVTAMKAAHWPTDAKHFGAQARYADPVNQRYPLDTEANIIAAWRALNDPTNNEFEPAELELAKRRVAARACECGIELSLEAKSYTAQGETKSVQSLHDVAVSRGAVCAGHATPDGANKSADKKTSRQGGPTSAEKSAAAAVQAAAADESADKAAQDALIAAAKAFTRTLAKRTR